MSSPFSNKKSLNLFNEIEPGVLLALIQTNTLDFKRSRSILDNIYAINQHKLMGSILDNEQYANDLYILRTYLQFINLYINLWDNIYNHKYSDTWVLLQDCLSILRQLKKFSSIKISFYEKQLTNLEKVYPYKIFTSIGMTYSKAECVLCKQDIDSFDCKHIKGNLYWGKMARAQLTGIVEMDHLSLTPNPKDKRCIIRPPNGYENEFMGLDYLKNIAERPSNFDSVNIDEENSHLKIILTSYAFSFETEN